MESLSELLRDVFQPRTCYVLGAGASAPDVPLTSGIWSIALESQGLLSSWPGGPIKSSWLRREVARELGSYGNATLEGWKLVAQTSATLNVLLEQRLARARRLKLPQYEVFSLFPKEGAIVSFNWDGLSDRCLQRIKIDVHGRSSARLLTRTELEEMIEFTQLLDGSDNEMLTSKLVFPGHEASVIRGSTGEAVYRLFKGASSIVIIGHRMGTGDYDEEWQDLLYEATKAKAATIHVVSGGESHEIADKLSQRLGRWTIARADLTPNAVPRIMSVLPGLKVSHRA